MNQKIAVLLAIMAFLPLSQMATSGENSVHVASTADSGSHTVLLELGSLTTCPYCPSAAEALKEIASSPPSPFYYVVLVYDESEAAQVRGRQLKNMYVPMLYVDGGHYVVEWGMTGKSAYEKAIEEAAARNVHDIDMTLEAAWNNGNIDITLTIDNHGSAYLGRLRLYVVEKDSRWIDSKGKHYNNSLLDYKDNFIFVGGQGSTTIETSWENSYDLEEGNALIIISISHWLPEIGVNPPNPWYYKYFLAFPVDECIGVEL